MIGKDVGIDVKFGNSLKIDVKPRGDRESRLCGDWDDVRKGTV